MLVKIFTAYPEYFQNTLDVSLLKSTKQNGIWKLEIINIRDFGVGKHKKIDDITHGGGSGLIMRPDTLEGALKANIPNLQDFKIQNPNNNKLLVLTSPRGSILNQNMAQNLSKLDEINIICNRFEGVDQRIIDYYNINEISIGQYILLGGEVAVCVILESVLRLIDGFLENNEAVIEESFCGKLKNKLEYPQYTKPQIWNEIEVPSILKSGNHEKINAWRMQNAKSIINKND